MGRPLTEILPIRGKHVAHDGKAACPSWASVVPIYGHKTICVQVYSFIIEIRVEKCSAALKVRVEKCGIVAKVRVEKCIFALFLCYKSILNYQRNLKKNYAIWKDNFHVALQRTGLDEEYPIICSGGELLTHVFEAHFEVVIIVRFA